MNFELFPKWFGGYRQKSFEPKRSGRFFARGLRRTDFSLKPKMASEVIAKVLKVDFRLRASPIEYPATPSRRAASFPKTDRGVS
jgi:hypothetical protein